jgi:hypothetical protein
LHRVSVSADLILGLEPNITLNMDSLTDEEKKIIFSLAGNFIINQK